MTRLKGDFPNVEQAVVAWLKSQLPSSVLVVSELPLKFGQVGELPTVDRPVVLVEQVPGGSSEELEMENDVDLTLWATSLPLVWALAKPVNKAMRALPGRGPVMIDSLRQNSGFGRVPYSNANVRRAVSTFRFTTRSR